MRTLVALAALLIGTAPVAGQQAWTVWTPYQGPALEVLRQDVADFAELFDVDVEVEEHDLSEIRRRWLAEDDEGPVRVDVVVGVPHDEAVALAQAGVAADLRRAATDVYLSDLHPQARAAFTVDGALVGLPMFAEGPALLYDRAQVDGPPASYAELVDRALEVGFAFDAGNFYFAYAWLATQGGYLFGRDANGPDAGDVGLATDGAVAGAEALRALAFPHGLIDADTSYASATGAFRAGRIAMTYDGPWAVAGARRAGIDVAVAPMPPLADGTPWRGFMSVEGVMIDRRWERSTEVVNLAKWIARSEALPAYAARAGRVPVSDRAGRDGAVGEIERGFAAAARAAEPVPTVPAMGRVWGPMERALERLLRDPDAEVRDLLEDAVRTIRSVER
ncbi:MAG: extracellular solute-binding protein [Trueperaceae bacterium]